MDSPPPDNRDPVARVVLVAGLGLAVVLTTAWAWLPVSTLLNWIPDDSFYYFQPASLMARGYVPSFDGVNPGNGFNPLWMAVLAPIFALKKVNVDLPIHITLTLAGFIWAAGGYVIYKILRRFDVAPLLSAWGGATYALWPSGIVISVSGEVTPVNNLLLGLLLLAVTRIILAERAAQRDFLFFGALGGLAVLARSDNLLLLGLLLVFYLTLRRGENKWVSAAVAGGAALVFILPSLGWNYYLCRTLLPTSGWAVPLVAHTSYYPEAVGLWGKFRQSWANLGDKTPDFFVPYSPFKIGVFCVYGFVAAAAWFGDRVTRLRAAALGAFLAFIVVLYLVNVGLRWYLRDWHLGAALAINQLFTWFGLDLALKKAARRRLFAHLAGAFFLLYFVFDFFYTAHQPWHPWQREMMDAGKWLAQRPDLRVGAFSAGILAYYSADNVVDLDGNMNGSAFEALKRRELHAYCKERGVRYVIDYEKWIYQYYKPFWPPPLEGKVEAASYQLDDPKIKFYESGKYTIFRIK